jgi:hypothetical protein
LLGLGAVDKLVLRKTLSVESLYKTWQKPRTQQTDS